MSDCLILDKNRVKAIKKAERENFDLAILDDGFQDHKIKKMLTKLRRRLPLQVLPSQS